MNTAFARAVQEANERFTPSIRPIGAVLVSRTATPTRLARYVFNYLGFELRIEIRDTAHTPEHYVFWAALATGPFHLRVRTLVHDIVGPGDLANMGEAMNLVRLALLEQGDVNRAVRRKLGPFAAGGR